MEYKTIELKVAHSAANEVGYIKGYASVFNLQDQQGDIILPGAFSDSTDKVQEVKFLWQHDEKAEIGRWTYFNEDHHGFYVEGSIPLADQTSLEAYTLIDNGAIKGLSIGYRVMDSYTQSGVRYIKKLELMEISLVSFPANPMAVIHNITDYLSDVSKGISSVYEEAKKAVQTLHDAVKTALK